MRLHLILPEVNPDEMELPQQCLHEDCDGKYFRHHQSVRKVLRDTKYPEVTVHPTFRTK